MHLNLAVVNQHASIDFQKLYTIWHLGLLHCYNYYYCCGSNTLEAPKQLQHNFDWRPIATVRF